MRFSKDYSKLDNEVFTTIRKNTRRYLLDKTYKIKTPTKEFRAEVVGKRKFKKANITELIALLDADCSKTELIAMLEDWYGKDFDDFLLLTFKKEGVA